MWELVQKHESIQHVAKRARPDCIHKPPDQFMWNMVRTVASWNATNK
jgi:hypothetical protein